MKIKYLIILYLAAVAMTVSCSKDDGDDKGPDQNGGEAFRSEIVQVLFEDGELTTNEYAASLNGVPVTLMQSADNTLIFSIPADAQLGIQDLVIQSLGKTIHYDVKDAVLPASPDEVTDELFQSYDAFTALIDDSQEADDVRDAIADFKAYYENATDEDKKAIATTYHVNKQLFNDIIEGNYTNVSGRIEATDLVNITKFLAAVIVMIGGAFIGLYGVTVEKVAGIAIVMVGAYAARKFFDILSARLLNTTNVTIDGIYGDNGRGVQGGTVNFVSDVSKTLSFSIGARRLTPSDTGKTQSAAKDFFSAYTKYNTAINKLNSVINWVNDNVPFVSFKNVPLTVLPASSVVQNIAGNSSDFSKFSFTINHPNLTLSQMSFTANGELTAKIKVTGTAPANPIETSLKYSYTDEINTFSGTIPIKVSSGTGPLEGTWEMESFEGGYPVGVYKPTYGLSCPSIALDAYTFLSGSITFTADTYTSNTSSSYVSYNVAIGNDCEILVDGEDSYQTYNDSDAGSYILNGNQITVQNGDGENVTVPVTFITPNRISIDGDVYNRI